MTKSELKTGMVVELVNGERGMVLLGTDNGDIVSVGDTWFQMSDLSADMKRTAGACYNVARVLQPDANIDYCVERWKRAPVIWERKSNVVVEIRGKKYSEDTIVEALKHHCPE